MYKLDRDPTTEHQSPQPETVSTSESWAAEVSRLIGDLQGGTVRKLIALAAEMPQGPDAFAALRSILAALSVSPNDPNPVARAVESVSPEAAARRLVSAALDAVNVALEDGVNDEVDPLIRASDFGAFAGLQFTAHVEPHPGLVAYAPIERLPRGHIARSVRPACVDIREVLILGPVSETGLYRLSAVRRYTAAAIEAERAKYA